MSNFSNIPISHYKVLSLPLKPEPNSVYYLLDQDANIVKGFITDKKGVAIPLFNVDSTGSVQSVTGTGVTGTSANPKVNIATFVSSQLGNQVYLSTFDGKLQVNPITSPDSSIQVIATSTELQLQLSSAIASTINSALQPGDNITNLVGTKAEFNTALTDGDFLFVGDVSQYTDEQAQDAVGGILIDTPTIDLTYNDSENTISADVKPNSITATQLADNINISEFVNNIGYELTSNKGIPNGYTPLDGNNKVPLIHINDALIGNVHWKGLYNGIIITSSPDVSLIGQALPVPSSSNTGWYFVSVADYTYSGTDYKTGDWIISDGITWNKVDNTDAVSSVFGRTGNILALNGDYTASQITNIPAGSISAITVQAALNELDTEKAIDANVVHKTGDEVKTGTLGVNSIIFNTNTSTPSTLDGAYYKLTQSTTAGQTWSTTYYPLLTKYNGLTDYVKSRPATFRKKLMVIGSSVAYGQGATGNNGWANRLGTELVSRGWTFKNHAIPGNNTTDVINRFYIDVIPENPDFLIIGLSLLNEGILGGGKEAVYDSFKKGIEKLVRMCRQHDIIPVLGNTYPNNDYTSVEYNYIQQINKELESWGVPVFNFLGATDDLTGKFLTGSFTDSSHPNDTGHQEMYKTIPPSIFDCFMNWDEKRMISEKGSISFGSDITTERPIESVFDGDLESFTVSFWMRVNDSGTIGKAFAGFGTGLSRLRNPSDLKYTNNVGTDISFGIFPEQTKEWYHITISYNSISQKVRAYLNGIFIGEISDTISLSKFVLGGRSDSGQSAANSINTNFKDVLIYRSRLTDFQIKELYTGNILKSSLEIYAPLSDKNLASGYRLLNLAPTYSYLKQNSASFTSNDVSSKFIHLEGNDSFTGIKSSTNSGTTQINGLSLTNSGTAGTQVIAVNTTGTGVGLRVQNSGVSNGSGISILNSNTGNGLFLNNTSIGEGYHSENFSTGILTVFNSQTGSTGDLMQFKKNSILTAKVDHNGLITAPQFIKSGATTTNILLAGGADVPQSTFVPSTRTININGVIQDLSANRQYRAGLSNTGVLTYAGANDGSSTTINVGAVTGVITDNETTPGTPSYTLVNYAGATNVTVPTIAGGTGTYVLLAKGVVTGGIGAGQLVFQNTFPTSAQRKSMIYLSKISHPNLSTISFVIDEPDFVNSPLQQYRDLFQAIQYMNQGVVATGNSGLTINTTNGSIIGDGINFVLDKTNPNMLTVAAGAPRNFLLLNQSGVVGSFVTAIDPLNYDVGGVTTAVGGSTNNSTIQYLYYAPGVGFAIQRGQTVYPSLVDAIAAVGKESFVLRANLVNNSILIAAICLRHTTTAMNNTAFVRILPADKFGQLGGASSGISVTSLQTAYNNSLIPQITTTAALGAVTLKNGGATDLVNVFATQNLAGTNTTTINGQGVITSSPSVSAASGIARGQILTPSLTATANNDMLVGVDISPTFISSGFTGLTTYALRLNKDLGFTNGFKIKNISTNSDVIFSQAGETTIGVASPGFIGFTTNQHVARIFNSGNFTLQNGGTFTDAGYRLDVQGTTRLNGDATINGFIGGSATKVLPSGNTFAGQGIILTGTDSTSYLINRWSTTYNEDGIATVGTNAAYDYRTFNTKSTNQPGRELTTYNISSFQQGSGSLNTLTSLNLGMSATGTGSIGNAYIIRTNSSPWATTSQITNFTGLDLSFMPNTTGGGVLNSIGIKIGDVYGSSIARGIDTQVSAGTGKHNIYSAGTADNYFNGNVGIGTSSPTGKLALFAGSDTFPSISFGNYTTDGWGILERITDGDLEIRRTHSSNNFPVIRMVRTNGNVLIGTTTDTGNRLRVNGGSVRFDDLAGTGTRTVVADASGNLSAPVSDETLKENIQPIHYGLNEIMKMNPVSYNFKDKEKYGEGLYLGNIAQDMEKVIPEAVFTNTNTGKMGIEYSHLHAVYIKAIQEQQNIITDLLERIEKLENEITTNKTR